VIATEGSKSMADNISSIFGSKFLSSLIPIDFTLSCPSIDSAGDDDDTMANDPMTSDDPDTSTSTTSSSKAHNIEDTVVFQGFISKAGDGVGRSDNERQFVYCNGRPVDLPKLIKAANEVDYY
jgi:DNA mismatch repair ATPase MutL